MDNFKLGNDTRLKGEIETYLKHYLAAVGSNRLQDELHFYADHVDYFNTGPVDRRIIERSLTHYYSRWPHRSYGPPEDVSYRTVPGRGEIVVQYRQHMTLSNGKAKAHVTTANEIIINAATSDPRIVSIKERRVR